MPVYRHVWVFKGTESRWTEVHHKEAADLDASIAVVTNALVDKRLDVLTPRASLDAVLVYAADPPGPGTPVPKNLPGKAPAGVTETPANVGETATISLAGFTGGRRKVWMRGLQEGALSRNAATGFTEVSPFFQQALDALINAWRTAGYGLLLRAKATVLADPRTAFMKNRITAVHFTADGLAKLTYLSAETYAVGQLIVVGGVPRKEFPRLAGLYRILAVDAGAKTLTVQESGVVTPAAIVIGKGYLYRTSLSVSLYNPNEGVPPKLGIRQTKNALTGSRGARSVAGGRG